MPDALIPRRSEIVDPGEVENLRPEAGGHLFRPVGRAGIHYDDLIDNGRDAL